MSSKRFSSDTESGVNFWRQGKGTIPQWDLQAQAMREATRVLAETEREEVHSFGHAAFHVSLDMLRMYRLDGEDDANAIVTAITDALPLLDELGDAVPVNSMGGLLVGIWSRNRATDAALDARS